MWSGKLLSFIFLLAEHGEALEADFQRVYGIDLLEVHTGQLSLRKASVLAMKLPAGSAVWKETGGPLAWSEENWFQSKIFHTLNIANWQRTENGRKGKNAPEEPKPPEYTHIAEKKQRTLSSKVERFIQRQKQMQAITGRAERDAPAQPSQDR